MTWLGRRHWLARLAAIALAALPGCGRGLEPPARTPAEIRPVTAERFCAVSGTGVSLAVRVVDDDGEPLSGVEVHFIAEGGGDVAPAMVLSDSTGIAEAVWRLGTRGGVQRARAFLVGGAGIEVAFTSTCAGSPAMLTKTAGDSQVAAPGGTLPILLEVRVTDAGGAPMPGVLVLFEILAGAGGSLSPLASMSDSAGLAQARWTLAPVAGSNKVRVTVRGVAPVTFAATTRVVWLDVSVGGSNTCGITSDNVAYCWGFNYSGTLGNPATPAPFMSLTPLQVAGPVRFRRIAVSSYANACAIAVSDELYCWGENSLGAVGNGDTTDVFVPTLVLPNLRFSSVSAGDMSCAITLAGDLYCWGQAMGVVPLQVGVGEQWIDVATDGPSQFYPRCALNISGDVYCLGGGIATPYLTGQALSSLAAGTDFACGRLPSGAGLCWGYNHSGQLGDGTVVPGATGPVMVTGGHDFQAISAGGFQGCGLDAAGQAWCWGNNTTGGIGDSTFTTPRPIPTAVAGGLQFNQIDVGGAYATGRGCGITPVGALWCWGNSPLGDGSVTSKPFPILINP